MSENYIRSEIEDMKEFIDQILKDIPSTYTIEYSDFDERIELEREYDANLRATENLYEPEKHWKYLLANRIKELVSLYIGGDIEADELSSILGRYSDALDAIYESATDDATKVKIDLYLLKYLIEGCIEKASDFGEDQSIDIPISFLIDLL